MSLLLRPHVTLSYREVSSMFRQMSSAQDVCKKVVLHAGRLHLSGSLRGATILLVPSELFNGVVGDSVQQDRPAGLWRLY